MLAYPPPKDKSGLITVRFYRNYRIEIHDDPYFNPTNLRKVSPKMYRNYRRHGAIMYLIYSPFDRVNALYARGTIFEGVDVALGAAKTVIDDVVDGKSISRFFSKNKSESE